ncbi:DUF4157 domain-containing protein [Roseomonas sp. GCM10028921]
MFAPPVARTQTRTASASPSMTPALRPIAVARPLARASVGQAAGRDSGALALAPSRGFGPRPGVMQAKLVVGEVDDPLEKEADRVADRVMRMPDPAPPTGASGLRVSRACAACEEEELRRAAVAPAALSGHEAPPLVGQVLARPGRPLDAATRAFFEPRLGLDLGHVRLHDDPAAAQSARQVGARAYTVGGDIAFADGVDTRSEGGRRLLAHELAHVAQQTGGSVRREAAPVAPSGASGALAGAADRISGIRARATAALAGSGLAPSDAARIQRNLATCAAGEERLRAVARGGGDVASANVLSAFTPDGIRQVIPRLTRVHPAPRPVAVNATDGAMLAAMPVGGADLSRPLEREAERVAATLVPSGALARDTRQDGVLRRLLSSQDAQQIAQVAVPAAPAAAAGAAATAGAIATAPLWVWVVVAVVVVAIAAAALYFVFSDDDTTAAAPPAAQPAPAPAPVTSAQPAPRVPVMPSNLTAQEQAEWRECSALHDEYKQTQIDMGVRNADIDRILDNLRNNRPVSDQERVDLCNWLEEQLRLAERLHSQRQRYVDNDCDKFDWFNEGRTAADRRRDHETEIANLGRMIRRRRLDQDDFCPPFVSKRR